MNLNSILNTKDEVLKSNKDDATKQNFETDKYISNHTILRTEIM